MCWRTTLSSDVKLGTQLGGGCGGLVFEGMWKGARVAVKQIWHQRHGFDSNRFASQEALFSKAAIHPYVVTAYRSYTVQHIQPETKGQVYPAAPYDLTTYIVMERCESSLEDKHACLWELLNSSFTMGLSSVLKTLVEVVVGLEYLHSIGIVHGDLKCSNILCQTSLADRREFRCKISDFGLSRFIKMGSKGHTDRPGAVLFAAPEKMLSGYMCATGDVFSFGMIAWFLISKGEMSVSDAEHNYQESKYRLDMDGTVTQVVISRPGQAAVVICRVRDTRDRVYFPMRQVHTLVLADRVPYQTYYRALKAVSHGSIHVASPALRAHLAAAKALGARAKTGSLVSVATLLKALAKLGVSAVVTESIKAAQHGYLSHISPPSGPAASVQEGTAGTEPQTQPLPVQWLQKLWRQLNLATPKARKDIVAMEEDGRWIDAADYARLVDKEVAKAKAAAKADGRTWATARGLHDVLIAGMLGGYLPPTRASCVMTLMKPTSLQRFCQEQGCDLEGCLGNRLFWATDAQGAKMLKLDLPHHKNFNAWDAQPMAFILPESLTDLFRRYFKWGHKILTEYQGQEGVQYCFVNKQGRAFSDATFCLYWQGWLEKSAGVRVSPQVMRHIFVDGLRSNQGLPFIAEKGAAMAMGNSTKTWDACYDTRFHGRLAQTAVDKFGAWHAAMIAHSRPTTAPAQLAVPDTSQQGVALPTVQSAASRQQLRQEMLGDQEDEEDEEDLVIDLTYDE
ncbi:hypothetical protein WJX72_001473 [[Myrmecia] bisecta]|uniref:Protein kinase domain-containing protein n=1 Tax=[Myrmecia] bisecta TaxID=41462 RepID=A0AAW1PWV9_9CHLO